MQKVEKNETGLSDIEFYIIKFDKEKQERLQKIRSIVEERLPTASERIYYGIPTVERDGRIVMHYAAYKNHISIIVCYELVAFLQESIRSTSIRERRWCFQIKSLCPRIL